MKDAQKTVIAAFALLSAVFVPALAATQAKPAASQTQRQQHDEGRRDLRGQHRGGHGEMLKAVAEALKLTEQQLLDQLRGGKTLTEIAKAKGVSATQLHALAVSGLKSHLATEVKAGQLTQAQANDIVKRAEADAQFGLQLSHGGPDGRGEHDGHGHGPRDDHDPQERGKSDNG